MYSVQQYENRVSSMNEETQNRFGMIKTLSKDFTVFNQVAKNLDELLVQQIQLSEPKPTALKEKPTQEKKAKSTANPNLDQSFQELFDAIKNHTGSSLNQTDVEKAVRNALENSKIGYDHLDQSVQRLLSSSAQTIRYELPPVVTTSFKKPEIQSFQHIVDDMVMGNNVMLVGGAGTGKTYLAESLISKLALGRNYLTINCSQWTSPTEIIGGQTMDGFQEGKLIEAWKNGYVLILDELPKIDPNTAGLLNDALAKSKVKDAVIFNSRRESFKKHENFACIATGNIYPDKESMSYGANNKQDLSLLDRFSGSVYFIEKNPSIEKQILQNDMLWSICNQLRSAIEELKYEAQLSLRFMQNARDSFSLEMQRIKSKGKNGVDANEGKTFKSSIDSFLSVFTEIQRENLKTKINYVEFIKAYQYRSFLTHTTMF